MSRYRGVIITTLTVCICHTTYHHSDTKAAADWVEAFQILSSGGSNTKGKERIAAAAEIPSCAPKKLRKQKHSQEEKHFYYIQRMK
jgi:hypothetical protein